MQTQIGGGEGGRDGAAVHALGSLGLYGGQVEDVSENGLVVLGGCIGRGLVLVEETLDMFCVRVSPGDPTTASKGREAIPHPYNGMPG